jgi:hypothetical protein
MQPMRLLLLAAALTSVHVGPVQGEPAMNNPPRTQADIQKERMAACKALRGQAFKDCMQNYVGTQKKSQYLDTRDAATPRSGAPPIQANQSRPEAK